MRKASLAAERPKIPRERVREVTREALLEAARNQRLIFHTDLTNTGQWSALNPSQPSPACYDLNYFPAGQVGSWNWRQRMLRSD